MEPSLAPTSGEGHRWETAWSPQEQRWYFQDRLTGTSSWDCPVGCTLELPTNPPEVQPPPPTDSLMEAGLPPGWQAAWDSTSRKWYYYNHDTKERVWKRPTAASTASPAAAIHASTVAPSPAVGGADRHHAPVTIAALEHGVTGVSTAASSSSAGRARPTPEPLGGAAFADPWQAHRPSPEGSSSRARRRIGDDDPPWDPEAWLLRLHKVRETSGGRGHWVEKPVFKEVAEHNYLLRHRWGVPRTVEVPLEQALGTPISMVCPDPEISFSSMSTADALLHFASVPGAAGKVCALNFANGVQVGGGYKTGAKAQEEDLCRRIPSLYTSLFNAKRDGLYPFGPSTCASREQPAKYSTVLWTPDLVLARKGEVGGFGLLAEEVIVALVTAAAPNRRFADPPEIYDLELMYNTIKAIFLAPRVKRPEVTTLILGAWGCGAFGGDPVEISKLFCRALIEDRLGQYYKRVHFAIPKFGEDPNADIFREALRSAGIRFVDLDKHV